MRNSPIQAKNQCDKENISLKTSRFLKALSVTSLFPKANIKKMNGIAPIVLLSSIMATVFSGKNFFDYILREPNRYDQEKFQGALSFRR